MALDPAQVQRERLQRPGAVIAFVVSTFHRELTSAMLESAKAELKQSGVAESDMPVAWVPGAFELPLVARRFAQRPEVDAVICLGLVLKGETTHDLYVSHGAMRGISQVSLDADKPVLFGVLTCNTLSQARARALPVDQGGEQDKGRELARAALETLATLDELDVAQDARHLVGFPSPPTTDEQ
jgi:6,7-dimethyl-8-ribityllumazine synthase